ncbi:MAG TPA: hypothetical protein VF446_19235 [Trinickia sp.]
MNTTSIDPTDLDAHVCAYNMAFAELGLRFRWDARTLVSLADIDDEAARIVAYVETHHPHLLTAYSAEFLSQAILEKKNALRPEPLPLCDAAAVETNRPSVLQERAREAHPSVDFGLPMLAGA